MNKNKTTLIILILIVAISAGLFVLKPQLDKNNSESNSENDNTPIELEYYQDEIKTYSTQIAVNVVANKKLKIENLQKYNLTLVNEDDDEYKYVLEIKNLPVGNVLTEVKFKDSSDNEASAEFNLTREAFSLAFGQKDIENWPGSVYTIDGNELLAQVDKGHKLTDDFVPEGNLVDLAKDYLLYTNSEKPILLKSEAADYLSLMLRDLKKETGQDVIIASGYRSMQQQYIAYANTLTQVGKIEADKLSARPGYSEHQLGTSVDFVNKDTNYGLSTEFTNTTAGKWILEHAHEYGFVLSYPAGVEDITGYHHEAWHWRYIGVESATEFVESGLTLNKWLEVKS